MSRSYKHTPRSGEQKDKFFKKYANRKVRRLPIDEHPLKGTAYKKVFCQFFFAKIKKKFLDGYFDR